MSGVDPVPDSGYTLSYYGKKYTVNIYIRQLPCNIFVYLLPNAMPGRGIDDYYCDVGAMNVSACDCIS